jgi:hypothetical protein
VADPAAFVMRRAPAGGVHAVEAFAVMFAKPAADAVAMLLSVVHAARLPLGTLVLTVTVDEAPGASVPGEHVSIPADMEQVVPL